MRRSQLLRVTIHCPHHGRAVEATRNAAIDRLVDCASKDGCRTPSEPGPNEHERPYPRGCPVFPSLSR